MKNNKKININKIKIRRISTKQHKVMDKHKRELNRNKRRKLKQKIFKSYDNE